MAYAQTTKKTVKDTNALRLFIVSTGLAIFISILGISSSISELIVGAVIVWLIVGSLCVYALNDELEESRKEAREKLKKNIKSKYAIGNILDANGSGGFLQGDVTATQPIQFTLKDEVIALLVHQQEGTYEPVLKDLNGTEATHLLKQDDFF